jgi:hypothetical protein
LAHFSDDTRYLSYLKRNGSFFLNPINPEEKEYLLKILDNQTSKPETYSQKMMLGAAKKYSRLAQKIIKKERVSDFLDHMLNKTQFLVYLVDDYTASIRMFESINDRGMPLGYFEKIKSFFLYFSDKYLSRDIDEKIHVAFDVVYRFFDNDALVLGINSDEKLLLYHYQSNPVLFEGWSYTKSTEDIFLDSKSFVLNTVQKDINIGKQYIMDYLNDLVSFINSCILIEEKLVKNITYKEFYLLLEPRQRMYPLSIRLNQIGLLDESISMLEKIEFYLKYKRDPKKDIFRLLEDIINFKGNKEELLVLINNKLYDIYQWQNSVVDIVNDETWATKYALYIYNKMKHNQIISCNQYKKLEIEHIFAQEPSFPVRRYGFTQKTYEQLLHTIGNKTLLEKELNGSDGATNKTPEDKIRPYYIKSDIKMTLEVNVKKMEDINERNNMFEEFLGDYFYFESSTTGIAGGLRKPP